MKTALLIIDVQNDYFENGRMPLVNAKEASEKAKNVLNLFREKKLPVIHIQHISTRPAATFFLPNTDGIAIHENVKPAENEKVIIKNFPNSFKDTELLKYLNEESITELVICGMMTQNCVDSTVRAAKDYDFNCVVIGDACATKDLEVNGQTVKAEQVQIAFLASLNYYFAKVKTLEQYIDEA
ncbi:MAG: cysteine hydrolase [Flavobacterium sp.]|nr:MAG: cysteine hydrolase [Flavobacterium sp.]